MPGVNGVPTPGGSSFNPAMLEQIARMQASLGAAPASNAAPKPALQAHHQILEFLREQKNGGQPVDGEVLKDNLNDFVRTHNKGCRKAKHVPKLSLIKEADIEHIQALLLDGKTDELRDFMRKKRWGTVTLIIGDKVVTLSRPKSKEANLQYVNSHMDPEQAKPEDGQLLDLDANAAHLLAGQLLQSGTTALGNGPDAQENSGDEKTETVPQKLDENEGASRLEHAQGGAVIVENATGSNLNNTSATHH